MCPCGEASNDPAFIAQHADAKHQGQVLALFLVPRHAVDEFVRRIMSVVKG